MIDDEDHIKIIDFGFSVKAGSLGTIVSNYCGTPAYMAPEIVKKVPYQPHLADIWALGVLLHVLLTGKYPFHGSSEQDLY